MRGGEILVSKDLLLGYQLGHPFSKCGKIFDSHGLKIVVWIGVLIFSTFITTCMNGHLLWWCVAGDVG